MSSNTIRNFVKNGFGGNSGFSGIPNPTMQLSKIPDPNEITRNADPLPTPVPEPLQAEIPSGRGISAENFTVSWFDKTIDKLKDRSVIFYGPSGSGKTVLIYDIMYEARNTFPRVLVFAPTNREKRDYENVIPKELIYEEFGLDDIKELYNTQRAAAHTYNTANDIHVLKKLFLRIATPPQKAHEETIMRHKQRAVEQIKKMFQDEGIRKHKLDELEDLHKRQLIDFYKTRVIQPNIVLLRQQQLTHDEQLCVKFLNYNPRILVIFDDAMTEILTLIKKGRQTNDNVILDFFYKGRWAYITHFYAFQDDNRLESEIKKNAFYSIFTSPNVASAFFGRSATNFSKQDKAKADAAIKVVFATDDEEQSPNHRKLVYSRLDSKNPFQYTIAKLHGDFQMCSKNVRNFCKKVGKADDIVDKNNPYLKRFSEF